MTVRDLGYRAYEGTRLPPSHNTWVMLRHGLKRVWGSWVMIVLAILACFIPLGAALIAAGIESGALSMFTGPGAETPSLSANEWLRTVVGLQMWLWVTLLSVRSGAGIIAEDFSNKAFQFYFAKPVVPVQYLIGRAGALAIVSFALVAAPTLLTWLAFMATATPELRLERAGLLLPLILDSALIAVVLSAGAIGCSSLSKSRALTISAWILMFIVPHVIALIVDGLADWPWLYLLSIPGLLATLGDALFKVEAESALRWYHAAPVLAGLVGLGLWGASERVKRAEVIT